MVDSDGEVLSMVGRTRKKDGNDGTVGDVKYMNKVTEATVAELESLLQQAREGKLLYMAFCALAKDEGFESDGSTVWRRYWEGFPAWMKEMIGEMEILKALAMQHLLCVEDEEGFCPEDAA
jgi:hypothetical protein